MQWINRRTTKFSFIFLSQLSLLFLTEISNAENIRVGLRNFTSFDYVFEYSDNVCGVDFTIGIASDDTRYVHICSSGVTDDGYGSINYRKQGNTSWTQKNLISDGDIVNLN